MDLISELLLYDFIGPLFNHRLNKTVYKHLYFLYIRHFYIPSIICINLFLLSVFWLAFCFLDVYMPFSANLTSMEAHVLYSIVCLTLFFCKQFFSPMQIGVCLICSVVFLSVFSVLVFSPSRCQEVIQILGLCVFCNFVGYRHC